MVRSFANQRLLDRLTGKAGRQISRRMEGVSASPTLVLLEDPVGDLEELVEATAMEEGKRPSAFLRRRKDRQLGLDASTGAMVLNGRECCMNLVRALNRQLHRMRLPTEHVCVGCGTRWGVQNLVREERRHG